MRQLLFICLFCVCLVAGCQKDKGLNPESGSPSQSFGFQDKFALRLVLAEPHLYVCAGTDGLWRINIRMQESRWEHLGLADSTLGRYVNRGVQDVLIHSQNPDWILVAYQPDLGSDHGMYRSLDEGRRWAPADGGLEFYVSGGKYFRRLHRFLEYSDRILGAGHGVYETRSFGEQWRSINVPPQIGGEPVYSFRRHPANSYIVWLGGEGIIFQPILGFSTDGGTTWTPINLTRTVPVDNAVFSIAFDMLNPDVVYIGMQGAIIKTTDGGKSWIVPLVTNPHSEFFRAILSDPRNANHLWAAAGPDLIETWNSGATWQPVESPIPETTKVFDMIWDEEREEIYVGTLDGVYRFEP